MPLQAREFVGTIDAAPAEVREEFRSMDRVWPNTLASIQYEVVDGSRGVGGRQLTPTGPRAFWERGSTTSASRRRRTVGRAFGRTTSDRRGAIPFVTTTVRGGTPTAG